METRSSQIHVGGVGQVGKAKEVDDVVTAEGADQAVPRRIRTQGTGQRTFTDNTGANTKSPCS